MNKKTTSHTINKTLCAYLQDCRKTAAVPQSAIAKAMKLTSSQYISNVERGQANPSLEMIATYIHLCGATVNQAASFEYDFFYTRLAKVKMRLAKKLKKKV